MSLIKNFGYRPDVDGLRAIAVLVVVLYHAEFRCPGGYVGVDIFFVISGFLITSLIWKDLENGKFTFANFWERRARRIVPPLIVITLVTLIAGYFLLLPFDFESLGRAAASQAVFGANVHYWLDSGYFAGTAKEKPLLHTWSLAVEEQFYLITPFLLYGIFRLKFTRRSAVLSFLGILFAISLAISVYQTAYAPSIAFYLLPSRAWELSLGAILAFLPVTTVRRSFRELIAIAGLLLILFSVFYYTEATPFPGLAALVPCVGAALLIWINNSKTYIGSLLSYRPVVFIGLISYSLYLWHWGFFAFARYMNLTPSAGTSYKWRLVLVGLGFLFALLSYKYVETPFRKRKIVASRKAIFVFAGFSLIAVFVCGLAVIQFQGFPQRFSSEKVNFACAPSDRDFTNELTVDDVQSERLALIGVPEVPPTILVWGDSHAMAVMPAFDLFLKEKGLSGRAATHSATAPILGWYLPNPNGLDKNSLVFNDAVFSYINKHHISNVVLAAHWHPYIKKEGFQPALLNTIRQINATGARVWIMLDVPYPSFDVPKALTFFNYSDNYLQSLFVHQNKFSPSFISEMRANGVQFLDPEPLFRDSKSNYLIQINNIALYHDGDHLTSTGAKMMLLPLLKNSFLVNQDIK